MPARLFDRGVRSARLHVDPLRIAEIAEAAMVCSSTVGHYRDGLHMLRATENMITWAIRALPPSPQLEIQGGQQHPREPLLGESPTMGQPGEFRSCPVSPTAHQVQTEHGTLTTPAGRSASFPTPSEIDAALIVGDDIAPPAQHIGEGKTRAVFAAKEVPVDTVKRRCRVTIVMPEEIPTP